MYLSKDPNFSDLNHCDDIVARPKVEESALDTADHDPPKIRRSLADERTRRPEEYRGKGATVLCADLEDTVKRALEEDDAYNSWVPLYFDKSNVYRYSMFGFLFFCCWLFGPIFMTWPPFDDLLHWANAFSHLCTPDSEDYEIRAHGEIYCLEKKIAIEGLTSVGVGVMFAFDFIGGLLLDILGAKVTACFGLSLVTLGWVLLGASSSSFNGYTAGVFFVAAGLDPYLYGVISVVNLFPRYTSTLIGILGTARSLAYGNGVILRGLVQLNRETMSLQKVSLGVAAITVVILVIHIIVLPYQSFPKYPPGLTHDRLPGEGKIPYSEAINERPNFGFRHFLKKAQTKFIDAKKYAITKSYMALIFVGVIQLIRNNYYSATYKYHLPNTTNLFTIMGPLSFAPCPLLGYLGDRFSTAYVLAGVTLSGALGTFFTLFKGVAAEVASVLFNWVCISFISSGFYCYVAYNYPLSLYGTLAGVVLFFSGVSGLSATALNNEASRSGGYLKYDIVLTVLPVLATLAAGFLHFAQERKVRQQSRLLTARAQVLKAEIVAASLDSSDVVAHSQ